MFINRFIFKCSGCEKTQYIEEKYDKNKSYICPCCNIASKIPEKNVLYIGSYNADNIISQQEKEAQMTIGRRASNIQIMEVISDLSLRFFIIYNLEKISADEVRELVRSGEYKNDARILLAGPKQISNIFPYKDEIKRTKGHAYWKLSSCKDDHIHCECSNCGFITEAAAAVKLGMPSDDYTDVNYRFCPKCGSIMRHKQNDLEE